MLVSALVGVRSVAAVNDTTPPVFQSLSVSPATIVAGNSVTITARITDDLSGVANAEVQYHLPNSSSSGPTGFFQFLSGTKNDGIWQTTITIPSTYRSGICTVNLLYATDSASNSTFVSPPTSPTPDGSFTVTDSNPPNPAPTLASVSPASGPTSGSTAVTLTGTNFVADASVAFGGVASPSVQVVNSTTIIAMSPAHVTGSVAVDVANSNQQAGTPVASLPNAFRYIDVAPQPHAPGGAMNQPSSQPQPVLHPVVPLQGTPATGPSPHTQETVAPTPAPTPRSQPVRH